MLVAQAWHWFDPERAIKEVARVLRPGGRLGLVWNTRDERLGWVKDLGRIVGHEEDPFSREVTLPAPFAGLERHQVEWTSYLTPQALIDLVASRSYCITSPADVRSKTLDEVRDAAGHPPRAGQRHRPGAAVHHGGRAGHARPDPSADCTHVCGVSRRLRSTCVRSADELVRNGLAAMPDDW